jgi:hypothetical protein
LRVLPCALPFWIRSSSTTRRTHLTGSRYLVDAEPDPGMLAERLAAMTVKAWRELGADPAAASQRREARARFVRDRNRWSDRAAEWVSFLEQVVH